MQSQKQNSEAARLMVCRNIHQLSVIAPEKVQNDDTVNHAVESFGFLLGMRESITFKEFADLIVGYSSSIQAEYIAGYLRSLTPVISEGK